MKKLLFIFAALGIFFLLPTTASAQCSGSGTTWSCAAGSTPTQVQSAINSATNGATITFAAGSYTWGGGTVIGLSNTKGVTLICASIGACTINASGGTVVGLGQYATGTNTNLYRISGFVWDYSGVNFMVWFAYSGDCGTGSSPCVMTQVRFDNNTINASNSSGGMVVLAFADDASVLYTFGVMDHNTLNAPASVQLFLSIAGTNNSPAASALGTGNNFFLENNALNITNMTNAGLSCVDGWGSSRTVVRYNTSNDCLWAQHGVTHDGGPDNFEFYNNSIGVDTNAQSQGFASGYRLVHHQGSNEMIAFNNTFTYYAPAGPRTTDALALLHYRDYANGPSIEGAYWPCDGTQTTPLPDGNRSPGTTYYGYPCWRQPGRDPATGNYVPIYSWNNKWSDNSSIVAFNLEDQGGPTPPSCTAYNGSNGSTANCDYKNNHMQANRENYDAVSATANTSTTSPFNGSTGMGFGVLANRPSSGVASSENTFGAGLGGTGYFATDVGAQGTLYVWTGSWTTFYTPYTYPHPLVGGGGGTPGFSISPPSFNFGNVPVGSAPSCPTQCQTFTISNPGGATTIITLPITNVGGQYGDFIFTNNNCATGFGGSLSPGQNCTIQIQYVPSIIGAESTTLTFNTNVTGTPQQAALTGTGVSPSPPTPSNAILSIR